jgi:hypothetical protein
MNAWSNILVEIPKNKLSASKAGPLEKQQLCLHADIFTAPQETTNLLPFLPYRHGIWL